MFILKSNVQETSDSYGTGSIALKGRALYSSLSFSDAYQDGDTFYYRIENTVVKSEWEEGVGTFVASTNSVTRTEVYTNSANDSQTLDFAQGTKIIFVNPYAEAMVVFDPDGKIIRNGGDAIYSEGYGISLDDDAIAVKSALQLLQETTEISLKNFATYKGLPGGRSVINDSDGDLLLSIAELGTDGRVFKTFHADTLQRKVCLWITDSTADYDATILVPTTSTDDIPVDTSADKLTSSGLAPSGAVLGFPNCRLIGVLLFNYDTDDNFTHYDS